MATKRSGLDPSVHKLKKHKPMHVPMREEGRFRLPVQRDVKKIAALLRAKLNISDKP